MCFFRGGGGDGGAAAREQARQDRTNEALAGLNLQFGVNEYRAPNREDFNITTAGGGREGRDETMTTFDEAGYQAAQDLFQQRGAQAEQNRQAREAGYGDARTNVSDYYLRDLAEQRAIADRQGRFALARRGVRGGSSDIDLNSDIQRRHDRSVLDIGNRADSTVTNLRSADERARLGLIDRVNAGMSGDSAIQSAVQQISNNLDTFRSDATAGGLGQIFADYAAGVSTDAQRRGTQRALDEYRTYNTNPANYRGRTY